MQARVKAELQLHKDTRLAKLEAGLIDSVKLLKGLQGQLGTCQSPQGLQVLCKRSQFLKVSLRTCSPQGLEHTVQTLTILLKLSCKICCFILCRAVSMICVQLRPPHGM